MRVSLSRSTIASFAGDVLPLYLKGEGDLLHADICWSVDGDAVTLSHFDRDENTPFTNGVLLSLQSPGNATVTALFEGNACTCDVTVRARRIASDTDTLHFFKGDLHAHTTKLHTPVNIGSLTVYTE